MAAITLEELLKKVGVSPEKLNEPISDDHLRAIALFLPSWRNVATYLELSEKDMDDVEQGGKNEQDKRLKSLKKWKGKFAFKATYRKFMEVLLSLTMADVAEKVCCLLKGTVYLFFARPLPCSQAPAEFWEAKLGVVCLGMRLAHPPCIYMSRSVYVRA